MHIDQIFLIQNIDIKKLILILIFVFFKRFDFETDELGFYFYHIYKLFLCVPFLTIGAAVIKQIILCPSKSNVITSI